MLVIEAGGLVIDIVGLGEDLKSCAIGTDIVKVELGASRAADINSSSQLDGLGLVGLSILEMLELLLELADVVVDVVLHSIRPIAYRVYTFVEVNYLVGVGLALGMKLVDRSRSNLVVL